MLRLPESIWPTVPLLSQDDVHMLSSWEYAEYLDAKADAREKRSMTLGVIFVIILLLFWISALVF